MQIKSTNKPISSTYEKTISNHPIRAPRRANRTMKNTAPRVGAARGAGGRRDAPREGRRGPGPEHGKKRGPTIAAGPLNIDSVMLY